MSSEVQFALFDCADRSVRVEYQWVGADEQAGQPSAPLIVFLHEGLGSLSLWKEFPRQLCDASGCRGLVYSRPGYGRSTPRAAGVAWGPDFLHRQAHEVLPALLATLHTDPATHRVWLFGHSDGASIALLYAARHSRRLAGAILLAPHISVEQRALASIEQARLAYLEGELRERLAKHHDDADSAFWGWNDIWLNPLFRSWSIEAEIASITCPVLAIQGVDDEYGTLEQIHGIARRLPATELLTLDQCRHSAHRDQPDAVIKAAMDFIRRHSPADGRTKLLRE